MIEVVSFHLSLPCDLRLKLRGLCSVLREVSSKIVSPRAFQVSCRSVCCVFALCLWAFLGSTDASQAACHLMNIRSTRSSSKPEWGHL